ncbi:hypothetical protein [Saccharothrix sp. HUAS TT1]|uniref:hypothetical protein n=1 Tax=unclassified Saccharothrix TaxID=2593673 RepID=UPI00345B4EED
MRLPLSAVVLGVLLAGCAQPIGPGAQVPPVWTTTATPGEPVRPATPDPEGFPVAAVPRPIVLIGPPLELVDPVGSEQEKVAAESGTYSFTGAEPPTPGPTSVPLPGGAATLPLIGVRDALAAMSAGGRGGEPLELVDVELGTARFPTDRGGLELPAWRFRSGFGSVWAWPAVAPTAFWHLGGIPHALHRAVTSDGVELEVELPAPPLPCPGQEPITTEVVVVEGATSVKVGVRQPGPDGVGCARDAMYRSEKRTVTLKEPLGARLLVDEQNGVVPVEVR